MPASIRFFVTICALLSLTAKATQCQPLLLRILNGSYEGHQVLYVEAKSELKVGTVSNGDIVKIHYKNGYSDTVVMAIPVTYKSSGGHGDPGSEYSYPTVPVRVNGLTGQMLVDERLIAQIEYVEHVGKVPPQDFPPELSVYPGESYNRLTSSYFLEP